MDQAGVWADALRERRALVHNDYPSLPHRKGLPEGHAEVLRELAVPVLRGGEVVALLGVGNKPFPYGPGDVDLVQQLADLAWETAEHKRTRERLRFEEAALEHSLNGVALADLEGCLTWVNPAFLRLWGLADRHAVLGQRVVDFWTDPQAAGAVLARLLELGAPIEGDMKARRRDGTTFDAHFTASLARDADGRTLGVLGTFLDATADRLLRATLAENEDRFRRTFDQAPYAAAMAGLDGRFFRINQAFAAFTGRSEEELLGQSFAEITHPEDRAEGFSALQRLVDGQADSYVADKRYLRKDGSTVWGHLNLGLVRGPDGNPLYFLPMIEDITVRRQAEAALRESEADLREAQRLAHLGNWKWALNGDRVQWSEELFRITGRDPAAGAPTFSELSRFYTQESWARLSAAVAQAVADGTPYELDLDLVRTDGEIRHTHTLGEANRDAEGRVVGLHGTVLDVTSQRQAEAALRARTEELDAYFSQGLDLFVIAGTDGHFRRVNRAWKDCLGYEEPELEGVAFMNLVHPDDRASTLTAVETLAGHQPVVGFVNRYRHRDGSWRWLEWRATSSGDTIYAAARDITDPKAAEAELRASRELLAEFVRHSPIYAFIKEVTPTESRVVIASDNFQDMVGIPGREMTGKTMAELFPAEFAAKITADDWTVASSGQVLRLDESLDGRHYATLKFPIRDHDRTLLAGYTIDLTDRVRAGEALAASEARSRSMLRAATDAVWLLDDQARFLEVNEAACRMLGYAREELLRLGVPDVEAREDGEATWRHAARVREEGYQRFETVHRRQDGSQFPVEVSVTYLPEQRQMVAFVRDISERKAAEAALREQAFFFRESQRAAAIGSYRADFRLGVWESSEVLDEIFGIGPDYPHDIPGWMALVHPEDQARMTAYLQEEVIGGRRDFNREYRILRPADGAVRWVLGLGRCSFAEDGTVLTLTGTIQDVTARKLAEAATQASEARLRAIWDAEPECVKLVSPEGILLDMNPAGLAMLEVDDPAQAIGKPVIGIVVPEHHERFLDIARRAFAEGSASGDFEIVGLKGTRRWMETHAVPLQTPAGPVLLAVTRDVSERRAAEAALRKAWTAVEQSPVVIVITDRDGRIEYVNPAFSAASGYLPEEVLGRNPRLVKSGQHPPAFYQELWETILAGRTWRGRLCNRRREGQLYWEQATISPIRDPAGRITHFVAVKENITEVLRREEEHRQLELQLARTQKLESLGSLAGGVAHDMNNVLAAILSLASVHQMTAAEGTPLRTSMDTIAKACLRGRTLVQGLLGFARNKLAEEQVLDLNVLIREQVTLLERTTLQKVALALDLAADLRPVKGDPSALSHALMNLCVNAVDAMPEGGRLTLRTDNLGDAQVLLEVADTGTGMPQEVLEKAMDPFFTTKPQGKGTGLGLPIVYGTVKAHRGQIELRSTPGEGTVVSIRLPAAPPAAPAAATGESGPVARSGLRVLVVDDDELIQQSVAHLLEALGHQPTVVGRGEEALTWLQGGQPCDLVILDLNMPGLGGAATLPRIRSLRPQLRVLLATGRADQEAIDLAASVPRTTLLAKPYALADLRRELGRLD